LLLTAHLLVFLQSEVAHVAHLAETEVVVVASLAKPVASSVPRTPELVHAVVEAELVPFIFGFDSLGFLLLVGTGDHVLGLSLHVIASLRFLASETCLSTLEIVVLTFRAFPATVWELEVVRFLVVFEC